MSKQKKINLRVEKGGFVPNDRADKEDLQERNYKIGDVVQAVITKPRNPLFNRLVHRIGWLCIAHLKEFRDYQSAHLVLKRLQLEGNLGCDEIMIEQAIVDATFPYLLSKPISQPGLVKFRVPQSLSFENMDEHEFKEISKGFCRHISEYYWQDLDADAIEEMAESFVEE